MGKNSGGHKVDYQTDAEKFAHSGKVGPAARNAEKALQNEKERQRMKEAEKVGRAPAQNTGGER